MSNDNAPFPHLRTAYMRAIARAWRDKNYMKKIIDISKSEEGVLPTLEREYGFEFPFPVKFVISDAVRPTWQPQGTRGWFGFADEFKLFLPEKPSPEHAASVLARYCAEFPSLLGQAKHSFREAPPEFASFGVVTSRILALTWSDPDFSRELFAAEDARGLVQDALDCMVPWNFVLKFGLHGGPSSEDDRYWREFPRSIITVNLPEEPELDFQPIALAAYNDTGGQYPFTC